MSLTLNIPPTPPSAHSPGSDDSNTLPRTPTSPNTATLPVSSEQPSSGAGQQGASTSSNNQMKRKPSRRANTAERRATHNAVERQRRETLNGRFLDLAALLPNLSQIRRPSKSSIVNSSIAHIHAFRRHRLLASRELRSLKGESDALRRELNEWRDRAALPRVEEPPRSEGFATLLSGEIEVLATLAEEDDENGGQGGYDDYGDDGDDYPIGSQSIAVEEPEVSQAALLKNMSASSLAHNMSPGASTGHILVRPAHGPMIASQPPSVSYENPAMASLYEPHTGFTPGAHFLQQQQQQQDVEKAWSSQYFMGPPSQVMNQTQQQQMLQAPRGFLTPPGSAHSVSPLPSPIADNAAANVLASQAIFANFQRQQQQLSAMQQQQLGHLFGSPELDDASSISSGGSGRDRSMSMGNGGGSGYCTPPIDNTYDDYTGMGNNRRVSTGSLHINTPAAWCGLGADGGADGLAMLGQSMGLPIGVGGGGNGGGFLMRM
jgi:hypothetical protein